MPVLDEEGFAINEYEGKQVRSNFWNQINPKLRDILEKIDGFNVGIDEWHYYVKEIQKEHGSYFVVYKNPNYKKLLGPTSEEKEEDSFMSVDSPTTATKVTGEDAAKFFKKVESHITESERNKKVGKAELKPRNDLMSVEDSILIPTSLFAEYVSIIVIRKTANIQIPEMYQMIKTFNDVSILGIKRSTYSTVSVRDVFGTG